MGFLAALVSVIPQVDAQHAWLAEVVDSGIHVGDYNSIVVDSRGHPHISYLSGDMPPNVTVKYAYKNDSGWRTEQVDWWGECPMEGSSIAVDSHDRPWIAYSGSWTVNCWDYDVRLAHWNGTAWEYQVVNPPNVNAAHWPSLVLDSRDRPHIAYYSDVLNMTYKLTYASWNGSSWEYQIVETTGWSGGDPSIISLKLDSHEWPHIAYDARLGPGGNYVHWNGTQWIFETIDATAGLDHSSISLDLDSRDLPYISYRDNVAYGPKVAHWDGSSWVIEMVSAPGEVGGHTSVVVDSKDTPHVAYTHTGTGGPPAYFLYYTSKLGGSWMGEIADPTEWSHYPSMAVDFRDAIHIAYLRQTNGTASELRYAYASWVDVYPPTSHVHPISPYWNGGPIEANATDRTGVANVTLYYGYSPDNSSPPFYISYATDASPPWIFDFTHPNGEGYYQFYSTAVDSLGNSEEAKAIPEAIMGYDITPPVSTALHISPYLYTAPSLVLNATATDNLSGVAEVTLFSSFSSDNVTFGSWLPLGTKAAPPWSWPFPFPDGEGYYRFHTVARDVAGNVEGSKTLAEAIAAYMPPPDYVPFSPTPSSPQTTGLSSSLQLSVDVRNNGGKTSTSSTLTFFDSLVPSTPFATFTVPPMQSLGTAGPFVATWTPPPSPCMCTVSVRVDSNNDIAESDETNNAYAWAIDVVSGPITTLVIGNPDYTSTATYVTSSTPLDFSTIDRSGLGIRNTTYRIDGGNWVNYTASGQFTLAGDGKHTLEWHSEDYAGNLENASFANLTVDDTPPATTISPATKDVDAGTLFSLGATDAGSGVNHTEYMVDGGGWIAYSGGFNLSEGNHNISYRSVDNLGNVENEKYLNVTVHGPSVPTQPPLVEANYKPLVALVFAVVLAVVGVWSSKRKPWKGGKDRMAVAKAFMITSMPFVLAEAGTGILSLLTGQLSIPPSVGPGTAVDLAILVAGLAVQGLRAFRPEQRSVQRA